MKIILVIIVMIIPSYSGTSFYNFNDDITQIKIDEFLLTTKIDNIKNKIDNEYAIYFAKRDSISNKNQIKFITSIECNAMNSKSLPSISIAQAILETGYGKYNKLGNNLFGIKGKSIRSKTKEYIGGKFVTKYQRFQNFSNVDHAFARHYEIIGKYGFSNNNYIDWANKIQKCGYATDPNYAKKIIFLIKKHELFRLDSIRLLEMEYNSLMNS